MKVWNTWVVHACITGLGVRMEVLTTALVAAQQGGFLSPWLEERPKH
jgi:hypothetical protein